jgi:hypothetical protein
MEAAPMNRLPISFLYVAALFLCPRPSAAQDTQPPPKVLVILREFVKPGKSGAIHDKSEAAFVQVYVKAKSNSHYLGMNSLTGKPRSLFFTGYESFEAWEKDVQATNKNSALSASLDRSLVGDGELLDSSDQGAFVYREDFSVNPKVDIARMRYLEIEVFHTKPGREAEWTEATNLVLAAMRKSNPDAHLACYQSFFGAPNGTYLFITPHQSASEIDRNISHDQAFAEAMGESGMKKLGELSALSIESSEDNLFTFNPKMSYVPAEWIKADPDFWKPRAASAAAKPPPRRNLLNKRVSSPGRRLRRLQHLFFASNSSICRPLCCMLPHSCCDAIIQLGTNSGFEALVTSQSPVTVFTRG